MDQSDDLEVDIRPKIEPERTHSNISVTPSVHCVDL